jgi:hypothetical protein
LSERANRAAGTTSCFPKPPARPFGDGLLSRAELERLRRHARLGASAPASRGHLLLGEPSAALAARARIARPVIACAQIDITLLDALLAAASDDERGAWTDWLTPGRCRGSPTV